MNSTPSQRTESIAPASREVVRMTRGLPPSVPASSASPLTPAACAIDKAGKSWTLGEIARTHAERLIAVFVRDAHGRRPEYGDIAKFQNDPHWRDYITFHEYFHGDTGVGLGASHQTGWTGLVASLIDEWRAD